MTRSDDASDSSTSPLDQLDVLSPLLDTAQEADQLDVFSPLLDTAQDADEVHEERVADCGRSTSASSSDELSIAHEEVAGPSLSLFEDEKPKAAGGGCDSESDHELGVDDVLIYTPGESHNLICDEDHEEHDGTDGDSPDGSNSDEVLLNENDTPMPYLTLFTLSCVIICDSLSITFIFPFLQWMVEYFAVSDDPHMLYVYAGILASSFSFAQCVASMLFGSLSDRFGRRPILLTGLMVNALALLAFGFSQTYWQALLFRVLGGALNGNMPVAKTYMGEVTHPRHHQKVFSLVGLVWSTGNVLGPALGGFLAIPADLYPNVFSQEGIFGRNPFLLPCVVMAFIQATGFVVGFFRLKESLPSRTPPAAPEAFSLELTELSQPHCSDGAAAVESCALQQQSSEDAAELLVASTTLVSAQDAEFGVQTDRPPEDDRRSSAPGDHNNAHSADTEFDLVLEHSEEQHRERERELGSGPDRVRDDRDALLERDNAQDFEPGPGDDPEDLEPGHDSEDLEHEHEGGELHIFEHGGSGNKRGKIARARRFVEGLRRPAYSPLDGEASFAVPSVAPSDDVTLAGYAYRPSLGARVRLRLRSWLTSTSEGLWSVWEVVSIRNVLVVTALYSLIGIQWIMFDETFSMWAKEAYETGGMGFSTKDIGTCFMVSGISGLVVQLALYAPIAERIGSVW
eukprot:CAMPEP_0177637582 /NCGR_PEP_ID=MMETSP0447-20121125/5045_1 /TAXON_ID=0 /ORGANISM="Stygamoeba regulata, Strain BSH-02190019" /LENGTH=683 /DNA_ID=CAMNT_0019139513 /DNA_START=58 /DNA_END=2106 /DNA_ORIENTATION=-